MGLEAYLFSAVAASFQEIHLSLWGRPMKITIAAEIRPAARLTLS